MLILPKDCVTMITSILVVCISFVAVEATQDRAVSLADQIRHLVNEEKNLRQSLEARVQRLRAETASVNASIAPCQCTALQSQQPTGPEVAYMGTISSTMTSLTANTVFNFTNDLVNVGQGFDISTGHFVVPVSGLYGFSLTSYMSFPYWVAMRLVKNGNQILGVKTGHYTDRQVNMGTNYVIGNFTAGEEIWPQYVTGSARLYAEGVSTFAGVLLHAF